MNERNVKLQTENMFLFKNKLALSKVPLVIGQTEQAAEFFAFKFKIEWLYGTDSNLSSKEERIQSLVKRYRGTTLDGTKLDCVDGVSAGSPFLILDSNLQFSKWENKEKSFFMFSMGRPSDL